MLPAFLVRHQPARSLWKLSPRSACGSLAASLQPAWVKALTVVASARMADQRAPFDSRIRIVRGTRRNSAGERRRSHLADGCERGRRREGQPHVAAAAARERAGEAGRGKDGLVVDERDPERDGRGEEGEQRGEQREPGKTSCRAARARQTKSGRQPQLREHAATERAEGGDAQTPMSHLVWKPATAPKQQMPRKVKNSCGKRASERRSGSVRGRGLAPAAAREEGRRDGAHHGRMQPYEPPRYGRVDRRHLNVADAARDVPERRAERRPALAQAAEARASARDGRGCGRVVLLDGRRALAAAAELARS